MVKAVVLSADMPQDHAGAVSEFVNQVCEDKPKAIVLCTIMENGEVGVTYSCCTVADLRNAADALLDEAMIRVIAANQDRIEKFQDD